ncbi:MAG: Ser-Thr-rich GPI-anchored membrane family protein [Bacteroidales bacterium]
MKTSSACPMNKISGILIAFLCVCAFNTRLFSNEIPQIQVVTVSDAWFTDQVDVDMDTYTSHRKFWFDVNVSEGSVDVYAKVYGKAAAGSVYVIYFTTGAFTVTGITSLDAVSIDIGLPNQEIPHGKYDLKIEILSTLDNTVLVTREPENDTDLNDQKMETSDEDPAPVVTVTSPNGGESLPKGSTFNINWDFNFGGNVKIELYKNEVFYSIIAVSTLCDGGYNWVVPTLAETGSSYRIKISSVLNPAITDWSDNTFTIQLPVLAVTSPNGGENWVLGSPAAITWNNDLSGNVKIELYKSEVFAKTISANAPGTGSFSYVVPNNIAPGTDYKIKISTVSGVLLEDWSDNYFSVETGSITVINPNGGEEIVPGSEFQLSWNDNISNNVKIELLKNGALSHVIAYSVPSNGVYLWNVSQSILTGNDYAIKISSVTNLSVMDESDNLFTIGNPNALTLVTPNGGDSLMPGVQTEINWNCQISANVKIELYKQDVLDRVISPSTSCDGLFTWLVPASITPDNTYRIKISSVNDASVFDWSDSPFSIVAPLMNIIFPNGGESFTSGDIKVLTWADQIPGNIKIELYKGETAVKTIVSSTQSDGSFTFTIPGDVVPGNDFRIKITDLLNPNNFDFSDSAFTISLGFITVTAPNGGESWNPGSYQVITWNSSNFNSLVKIELLKNELPVKILAAATPNDGVHIWQITTNTAVGNDYKIKVSVSNNSSITDASDATFSVGNTNAIVITSPDGGENWTLGKVKEITWTYEITTNVKIELYKNDVFDRLLTASTPCDGSFSWSIPTNFPPDTGFRVKITSVANAGVFDWSDHSFAIVPGSITVINPASGVVLTKGLVIGVTWTDEISENVKIELFKGDVYQSLIIASTPSDGSQAWSIPYSLPVGSDYSIKISSVSNPAVYGWSDGYFSISGPTIQVLQPLAGATMLRGAPYEIKWSSAATSNMNITLYKAGILKSTITASTVNDGSYIWTPPNSLEIAGDYQIRIKPVSTAEFVMSDFFFIGVPAIIVLTPNGGEVWQQNVQQTITWTDQIPENVRIELHKGGIMSQLVVASTPSDGSFTYNVPYSVEIGIDYKIKVRSVSDPLVEDMSDNNFLVTGGTIDVLAPDGEEQWLPGSAQMITWTDDISANVKIELFKGGVFNRLLAASTPSDGEFSWVIPSNISLGVDYQIKISSVSNPDVFGMSFTTFSIGNFNAITVTSPNGGEAWLIGSNAVITWSYDITSNVKIELYKNGVFDRIIVASTPCDGSHTYLVPSTFIADTGFSIKITSVSNAGIYDWSDQTFTISDKHITVIKPTDTYYYPGHTMIIKWTDNLTENVKIELVVGLQVYVTVAQSAPGTEFLFYIPVEVPQGFNYRIKISSILYPAIYAYSEVFGMLGFDLHVHAPLAGDIVNIGLPFEIKWSGSFGYPVNIKLYKGLDLHSVISPSTPNDHSYIWTPPDTLVPDNDYRIVIKILEYYYDVAVASGYFSLEFPQMTIVYPNGGEQFYIDSVITVNWMSNVGGTVNIELKGSGALEGQNYMVTNSVPNDGSYSFPVGIVFNPGPYIAKVTSNLYTFINDSSDNTFEVLAVPGGGKLSLISEGKVSFINPAGDYLRINFPSALENVMLQVYEASGKEVKNIVLRSVMPGDYLLPANLLRNGAYILVIRNTSGILSRGKLIVSH